MRVLNEIMKFQDVEVLMRKVYLNNKYIQHNKNKFLNYLKNESKSEQIRDGLYDKVINKINGLNIKAGDILLVHSSMDGLSKAEYEPRRFIDELIKLVGTNGTLVFPAYPKYKVINGIETYNPQKSLCWTGMMPNVFCTYEGVVRSKFPYNPLAAIGRYSSDMMKDNLKGVYPHGKNSAWEFCINKDMKILFLGISAQYCNTVVHAAEDLLEQQWPIRDWYENKAYQIEENGNMISKNVYVRRNFWSQFVTSKYDYELGKKLGTITQHNVDEVCVEFIQSSADLVESLKRNVLNNKLTTYKIPSKYYKIRDVKKHE